MPDQLKTIHSCLSKVRTLYCHLPHCSLEALTCCTQHYIALLSLHPHSIHKLYLSDRAFFVPRKAVCAAESVRRCITTLDIATLCEKPAESFPTRRMQKKSLGYRTVPRRVFDEDFFKRNSVIGPKEIGMRTQSAKLI